MVKVSRSPLTMRRIHTPIMNLFRTRIARSDLEQHNRNLQIEKESLSAALASLRSESAELREQIDQRSHWVDFLTGATPLAVLGIDTEGRCNFANSRAVSLLGVADQSQLFGRRINLLMTLCHPGASPRNYAISEDPVYLAIKHRQKISAREAILVTQGGTELPVEFSVYPVLSRGAVSAVIMSIFDCTERKDLEAKLSQSRKITTLGAMLGGISHDFNNLLTIIRGNLDLMRDLATTDAPNAEPAHLASLREMIDDSLSAAGDGIELTSRLMTFSRPDPGTVLPCAANELLASLPRLLARAFDKSINIDFSIQPNLPAIAVDRHELDNALLNLALNARDAMPQGGTLRISASQVMTSNVTTGHATTNGPGLLPGAYVHIVMMDTGLGMDPETLQRVFEPFYTTKGKGNGLGMAMVHNFVERSGGHIYIESTPGVPGVDATHGTQVHLYFPVVSKRIGVESTEENPVVYPGGMETILLVEDEARIRRIASLYLADLGYRVLEAGDAQSAVSMLAVGGEQVDLLLSDIVMPGRMNGRELAAWTRKHRPDVQVLLTSGQDLSSPHSEGESLPFSDPLLKKPFTKQQLAQMVRSTLDHSSARAGVIGSRTAPPSHESR